MGAEWEMRLRCLELARHTDHHAGHAFVVNMAKAYYQAITEDTDWRTPPPQDVMRCADCGVEVEARIGGWATAGTVGSTRVWGMTCRDVIEGDRLVSADYHYVQGETQRHWPPQDQPTTERRQDRGKHR
jgi:hypothetical protein